MNQLKMYEDEIYVSKNDVSNKLHKSCLSLPSSAGITDIELEYVVRKVKEFYNLQNNES